MDTAQDKKDEPGGEVLQSEAASYREVQFGKIYDNLEAGKKIDIAVLGNASIEIDEENLGLDNVSVENLDKGWERDKEWFVKRCTDLGIEIDPYEVYKYYQIQKKVFQVLGKPVESTLDRTNFTENEGAVKLSETKNRAMCSEYAILSTFLAQKIGEPAHLIIGSGVEADDEKQWRESHAYVWVDGSNVAFDSVLAKAGDELPALMVSEEPTSLGTLEQGYDVKGKRIGSHFTRYYGLEASGFGVSTPQG
ncbi:MAG: hypothetical protein WD231_02930 [Candidatus Woykebacteria bacterium]